MSRDRRADDEFFESLWARTRRKIPVPEPEPDLAPWKRSAKSVLAVRNDSSTIKRFAGDPAFAAALLPLAQTILGDLLSRLALGGIGQGARTVRLADGSTIRVVANDGINLIEIDRRWVGAWSARALVFVVHPHSDDAPNGWWWPADEATAREAMDGYYYPRHSFYSDGGVNRNFWWNVFHRPHARIALNPQQQRCKLIRDQDAWFGNQTVYSKSGAVWSWWHSPHGDAPLYALGGTVTYRARHTPYLAGGTLQTAVYYDHPDVEVATITPCVFLNSQLVWSYSDNIIEDFSNAITAADSALIGGVHPVAANRILVVVITNQAKTATLWDVWVYPLGASTKTSVWTETVIDANALRWPWRFHPDGTECSTIVAYTKDSPAGGGAKYTEYKIWTLAISQAVETGVFSASQSESAAYYLRHGLTVSAEVSGSLVYPGYGTMSSTGSTSAAVDSDHSQIPLACAYKPDGTRVVAWLDVSGTTTTSTSSGAYHGAAPGDYSDTGSSEGFTATEEAILIDGFRYTLADIATTSSGSSSEETLYSGHASFDTEGVSTASGKRKRIVFLDVLTKTVITYSKNDSQQGSSSVSASWAPGISGPALADVGGATTYRDGDYLWYMDEPLFADPVEYVYTPAPFYVDYPYITPPSAGSSSSTSYSYDEYPDQLSLSLDIGFGMAMDRNGFFIFSYDCKERDVNLGGEIMTLARKSGNHSNIPGFDQAIAFEGENKLLFPLGIGAQTASG